MLVCACRCLFMLLYICLLMNKHDFVEAEIKSTVHAHMLWVCVCVCVYVCFLKLVSFWLLPNHNSDIVAQPVTHTCTKTCSVKHTHMPAWTCIHAFIHSCRHRHTCICTCPHTYASCGSCYYAILQVMSQSICFQLDSKWERESENHSAASPLLRWGCAAL